jgi:hypothetical protein
MSQEGVELGPVDYALVEFPGNRFNGEIAPNILDLVSRGLVRILDLAFIKRDADGSISGLEVTEMDAEEIGSLLIFAEDAAGLLTEEDIAAAGEALEPNTSALFVVWENTWMAPLAAAIRASGGVLASHGRIPAQDIYEVLEAQEG